jgi:hypothetical protein
MHCFALFLQDAQNAQVLEFAAQNSAKLCILRKNGQNIAKQRKMRKFWNSQRKTAQNWPISDAQKQSTKMHNAHPCLQVV